MAPVSRLDEVGPVLGRSTDSRGADVVVLEVSCGDA